MRGMGGVVEVGDGVHAYVQPPGGWCLNNAGILVDGGHRAFSTGPLIG
ncbi:hypothetical protein OV450_8421 [Actinobacteria bacterium OV450]|nr:hypothetical protein OV450_8421 [Actinobacteria bacterium OV450]